MRNATTSDLDPGIDVVERDDDRNRSPAPSSESDSDDWKSHGSDSDLDFPPIVAISAVSGRPSRASAHKRKLLESDKICMSCDNPVQGDEILTCLACFEIVCCPHPFKHTGHSLLLYRLISSALALQSSLRRTGSVMMNVGKMRLDRLSLLLEGVQSVLNSVQAE
jgi:hypothetical protein